MTKKALLARQLKTTSDNIKRIRLERNYTQEYVGDMIHLSQNAYSKLELNYTLITVDRLIRIAIVLEVEPWELLGWNCVDAETETEKPAPTKSK